MRNVSAGVGTSQLDNPSKAAEEAVKTAIKEMQKSGNKTPTFGVVFCSAKKYARNEKSLKELVKKINDLFKCNWIGCTTAGELSNYGFSTGSCVALAVSSDYISTGIGVGDNVSKNPRLAGKASAKEATENLRKALRKEQKFVNPTYALTIFPGTTKKVLGHEEETLAGMLEILSKNTFIAGGSAGDDVQFEQTYQFVNGKIYKDATIVMALFSKLRNVHSVDHGYKPTRRVAVATESEGKIVKTLDNKPAAEVYAKLVGTTLDKLKENIVPYIAKYPFGFSDNMGNFWIKNPQAVLPDKSLLFFSPVPKNSVLYLLEGSQNDILKATDRTGKLLDKITPAFSIIISCAGRMAYLQKDIYKEAEILKKELKNTPFVGFYSYSEQSTLPSGTCGSFCQTLVGVTFSDSLTL
ncbi:MAG: FIST C-terminal domain-containing protein [Candidatus Aenigmarchaeota archaeon]|nr:FIST C-terminal domain-containing protein [Candidatus Aenigmarchaeota archaeon]